jgi:hypothetical protein
MTISGIATVAGGGFISVPIEIPPKPAMATERNASDG